MSEMISAAWPKGYPQPADYYVKARRFAEGPLRAGDATPGPRHATLRRMVLS